MHVNNNWFLAKIKVACHSPSIKIDGSLIGAQNQVPWYMYLQLNKNLT